MRYNIQGASTTELLLACSPGAPSCLGTPKTADEFRKNATLAPSSRRRPPPMVPRATSREIVTKIAEPLWMEAAMATAPRRLLKETILKVVTKVLEVIEEF